MDYSNKILIQDKLKEKILEVTQLLKNTVVATLGPKGKTSIIYDENGEPYITKDGVSVIKSIYTEDPFTNILIKLIKQAAEKTVDQAGDGTTSSTCLAVELIEYYIKNNLDVNTIDKTKEDLIFFLETKVKEIKKEDIYNIAKISANNDVEMASSIEKAFNISNNIRIETSDQNKDSIEEIVGHKIESGLLVNTFINDIETNSFKAKDYKIFIFNGKLNDLNFVKKLFTINKKLIIITEEVSEQVLYTLAHNYNKGIIDCVLIKPPGFSTQRVKLLNDLALILNTSVYNELDKNTVFNNVLPNVNEVEVYKNYSIIIPEIIHSEVDKLKTKLESLYKKSEEHDKLLIKQRLDLLEGKMCLIKVGGNSEVEVKEKYDRYEDAVLAVKSAREEGIIQGGGTLLKEFADSYNEFAEPYRSINNIISKDITDYTNVIDPYKVVKCSIENATSVAKVILTTSSIINN